MVGEEFLTSVIENSGSKILGTQCSFSDECWLYEYSYFSENTHNKTRGIFKVQIKKKKNPAPRREAPLPISLLPDEWW